MFKRIMKFFGTIYLCIFMMFLGVIFLINVAYYSLK